MWEARIVEILYSPRDPITGFEFYLPHRFLPRRHFLETLAAGFWPDGLVVDIALKYLGVKTHWRVKRCYLHEVDGDRVAISEFITYKYTKLREITNGGL